MQKAPEQMYSQILALARDNDAPSIRELCRLGCPPSFPNGVGQTALHIAGIWGSIEAVKVLLECRANPNAANSLRGSTPLHAASMGKGPVEKRAECLRLLVAAKGDPQLADMTGELPMDAADDESLRLALGAAPLILHKAIKAKSSSALADALGEVESGRVNLTLEVSNQDGETPLHAAAVLGWREGVERLLDARAVLDSQNNLRQTPLHVAVLSGDHNLAGLLLRSKAAANLQDRDQDQDPRFQSTTFQQNPYVHRSPLHYAAERGNMLVARLLLEAAADPNIKDSKLETPLHLCISGLRGADSQLQRGSGVRIHSLQKRPELNGRLASVFGPQTQGADAAAYPSGGGGAGRWPVLPDGEASEGLLLKEDNLTPLSNEIVDLLLEARADVNLGNQIVGEMRTPLHEAARVGDMVLLQKMISARAELDRKDAKLGLTPLHLAARSKQHDAIRILVEARADLMETTAGGKTAAELAQTNGAPPATVALLRGSEAPLSDAADDTTSTAQVAAPQTLDSLTAEQRAMLFID